MFGRAWAIFTTACVVLTVVGIFLAPGQTGSFYRTSATAGFDRLGTALSALMGG